MTITSDPPCPRLPCLRATEGSCGTCPAVLERGEEVPSSEAAGPESLPQALADFHDVHRLVFVKYVRSRGVTYDEAEEVVNQTFLQIYRARRFFLTVMNRSAFAFKILRDTVADHFRARDRQPRTVPIADSTPATATTDGGIDALICRLDVDKALNLLSARQSDCLRLYLFLDLSPAQIAYYLDISSSTVSSHLSAGRQHLTAHLEGYNPQTGSGEERHG